ncbi:hypothetical protein IR152_03500 [Clostridioides sp. ES-S-0108-01]|uniref:DUF6179 domain-containing protein n=1 Tax=Clostridioides sp. ES-S-0108-01 TaxID=2770773 RepID=UPI001D0CBD08|nr:hypothetical protein [Clostridioides sp. ES-S-0108-01]UDN51904.1 hypothetical protein JJC16_04315 [Clostridioides sp. ES-S-0107-01]
MSNNLSNININENNLIKNQYSISLLKECLDCKVIDEREVYNIQQEISLILIDLIKKYTNGQSTSVKTEVAEKLLISIWYAIDAYINKLGDIEKRVVELTAKNVKKVYLEGIKILEEDLVRLKDFYELMMSRKLNTNSIAYNDTLIELSSFFKNYVIKFEAHDIPVSIDYPLALDDMDVQGIYYVKNYIESIDIENRFCNLFKKKDREKLFYDYGVTYKIDCDVILVNLFELIINNCIFSTILGNEATNLEISEYEYEFLEKQFKNIYNNIAEDEVRGYEESNIIELIEVGDNLDIEADNNLDYNDFEEINREIRINEKITLLLMEAIEGLIKRLSIEDEVLIRYIKKYEKIFIESVISSIKSNTFKSMVTVSKSKNEHLENYIIDDESKLDDESFRKIFNKILDSASIIEKIRIIKENINAKKDFIDILESECLFGEEYSILFASLSELELAILGSVVFYEDIRMKEINLLEFILNKKTETTLWKMEYIEFISNQSEDKIHSIEEHMNKIN